MPLQILAGVLTFVQNWNKTANGRLHLPPPTLPEPVIKESNAHLRAIRQKSDFLRRLDRDLADMLFDLAQPNSGELFVWFYMKQSDELMVDLFFAGRDADGKVPADSLDRFRRGIDYGHGIVATDLVCRAYRQDCTRVYRSDVLSRSMDAMVVPPLQKRQFPAFHLQGTRETKVESRRAQSDAAFSRTSGARPGTVLILATISAPDTSCPKRIRQFWRPETEHACRHELVCRSPRSCGYSCLVGSRPFDQPDP